MCRTQISQRELPLREFVRLSVFVLLLFANVTTVGAQRSGLMDSLYRASVNSLREEKWTEALEGFKRLARTLSPSDSLFPLTQWQLASLYKQRGEYLLASSEWMRLADSTPRDSLADDALFEAGNAYIQRWRDPDNDAAYGTLGTRALERLLRAYPESPFTRMAEDALAGVRDYRIGMFYLERDLVESAVLFFKKIATSAPRTAYGRLAMLRLVQLFVLPSSNHRSDAAEICVALRSAHSLDVFVAKACRGVA